MFINEQFLKTLSNCNEIKYLFSFEAENFSIFLTTGDIDIEINGNTYRSGVISENISVNNLSKTDNIFVQILNIYDNNLICFENLLRSKVTIRIAINDSKDENFISSIIFNGFVSQIAEDNGLLGVTISPLTSYLNQSIGELFSPICRECLGSKKCGVSLENYKTKGKIINIISDDCFYGDHSVDNDKKVDYYQYGLVKFLSGSLKGICMQIKDEKDGKIFLLKNTKLLKINDEYEIYAGCDKTIATCKNKFNNVINFRGEPYIKDDKD